MKRALTPCPSCGALAGELHRDGCASMWATNMKTTGPSPTRAREDVSPVPGTAMEDAPESATDQCPSRKGAADGNQPVRVGNRRSHDAAGTDGGRITTQDTEQSAKPLDIVNDEVLVPDEWPATTLRERVAELASEAVNAVAGPRNQDYGDPKADMTGTAEMMNGYLHKRGLLPPDKALQPFDVPVLLEMVKLSRLAGQPGHHDSMVDVIGWMGVYQECFREGD